MTVSSHLAFRLARIPVWWLQYRRACPPTVVVLGMHRSGTSCVTQMVHRCGAKLGPASDGSDAANPDGYYESWTALQINRALLRRSGGAWDDPPDALAPSPWLRLRMQAFVAELHTGTEPAVWKDPRTVLTFPVWASAVQRPIFLAVFRHPASVARSLERRSDLSSEHGHALWRFYNRRLLALVDAAETPVVWMDFDAGRDHLVRQTQRVAALAGLAFDPDCADAYQPSLRRTDATDAPLPTASRRLYTRLRDRLPGD